MPHPTHDSAPVLQAAQQQERAQRARQARHLKRWKQAAFAVAIFPPLLSLILAWQHTGQLPTSLLVWLAVMVFMTVFGSLKTQTRSHPIRSPKSNICIDTRDYKS